LRARGVSFQRLPVDYAFHSRWLDAVQPSFERELASLGGGPARLPIGCCARARLVSEVSAAHWWETIRQPIRFHETITALERHGTNRYIDVGPAGTLATFLKYILPASDRARVASLVTPFGADLENLRGLVAGRTSGQSLRG
jgi:acyl transferase domain-containing protein